jgi:hypothetical protein
MTQEGEYQNHSIYRVNFSQRKTVTIMHWGVDSDNPVASVREVHYDADALPDWMNRKIAVLMTLPYIVPTEELAGIGRRVSKHIFWVYSDIGESIGTNAGSKGKGRRKKSA